MTDQHKEVSTTISDWLGDVVALESHVEEAMDGQLKLKSESAELTAAIQRFHDAVRDSKHRAEKFQEAYGTSTVGNPVIKAGATLLGKAAGVVDKIRKDSVSKALRDDYAAYNHLAIAYTMLHTTALALKDDATTTFAEQGLQTYAALIQDINNLMPEAVVLDLKNNDEVPSVDTQVVSDARATIERAWKSTSN